MTKNPLRNSNISSCWLISIVVIYGCMKKTVSNKGKQNTVMLVYVS